VLSVGPATRFPSFGYLATAGFGILLRLTEDDVVYNTLPFYHSAGWLVEMTVWCLV